MLLHVQNVRKDMFKMLPVILVYLDLMIPLENVYLYLKVDVNLTSI